MEGHDTDGGGDVAGPSQQPGIPEPGSPEPGSPESRSPEPETKQPRAQRPETLQLAESGEEGLVTRKAHLVRRLFQGSGRAQGARNLIFPSSIGKKKESRVNE